MSVETNSHNYTNMNNIFSQFFKPARNSPKENSGASGGFLPKPLLFHLRHPNSKTNERTRQFRATTRSARAIRSFRQDYQQNTFELCLIHTAMIHTEQPCGCSSEASLCGWGEIRKTERMPSQQVRPRVGVAKIGKRRRTNYQ